MRLKHKGYRWQLTPRMKQSPRKVGFMLSRRRFSKAKVSSDSTVIQKHGFREEINPNLPSDGFARILNRIKLIVPGMAYNPEMRFLLFLS